MADEVNATGIITISNYESSLSTEDHVKETSKRNDIVSQFVNVFSAIGASLISFFGG